jgi:hypothetical protein
MSCLLLSEVSYLKSQRLGRLATTGPDAAKSARRRGGSHLLADFRVHCLPDILYGLPIKVGQPHGRSELYLTLVGLYSTYRRSGDASDVRQLLQRQTVP